MRVAVDGLPVVLGIGLICGAAAIIISTANSFLLTPATGLVNDVYRRYVNPKASDRQVLLLTRLMVVVLGAAGFIALRFFSTILQMALWAYTMYGAAITPALLAAFFWRRATRAGGVASIAAGMLVTLGWEIQAEQPAEITVRDAHGVSRVRRLGPRSGVRQPGDAGAERTGPGCHHRARSPLAVN